MDEKKFNPDSVAEKTGIYSKSFYRDGARIDTAVIKAGIAHYTALEEKNTCEHCKKCNTTSIEYKAWLVAKDLKKAGWVFCKSVFFDDPVPAIALSAMGF